MSCYLRTPYAFRNIAFRRTAFALAVLSASPIAGALAEDYHEGMRDAQASAKQTPERTRVDQIDPHSGNLLVRHVDLYWKGNGKLDITVHRVYDLQLASAGLSRSYSSSARWMALGAGWSMRAAPQYVEHHPQSGKTPTQMAYLCGGGLSPNRAAQIRGYIEMPNGDREALNIIGGGVAITAGNWRVQCVSNIMTLKSPDGLVYEMGDVSTAWRGQDGPPPMVSLTYMLPAKKVTDTSGNWIAYSYRRVGTLTPYTGHSPETITSSDGRRIDFTYDETNRRLLSMRDNTGRQWTYEHTPVELNSSAPSLASVSLPGDETWRYSYAPGPWVGVNEAENARNAKLAVLTYPDGGTVTYEVEPFSYSSAYRLNGLPVSSTAKGERVIRRTLSNGDRWSYSYTHGGVGQYDITVESTPHGVITYKHMGTGYAASVEQTAYVNNMWRVGRLIEKYDEFGNREAYTWAQRRIASGTIHMTGPELVADEQVWAADMAERKITRDGVTYITRYAAHDSYGNPTLITETGPSGETRSTTNTYHIDTARWIVSRIKDEIRHGNTTRRTFDSAGRLLSIDRDGVVTSHTYDAEGNIASTRHPRGLLHTYSEYKRGTAQSESQPEEVTIRRVVSDAGNVISETNGEGKTHTFEYDGANRLTRIAYPVGNPTVITYSGAAKTSTRGALVERTDYDGFGRVAAITLGGITRSFRHDAFGREIFESDPGSTSGTTYQYDMLNRVTKVSHADGTGQTIAFRGVDKVVTDERGHATTYRYRSYGDPDQRYLMNIQAPEVGSSITFGRNANDLVSSITQGGVTRTYHYDASHYLTSVVNPESGTTTYGRDAAGNMTSRKVGSSGTTTYVYDGQNRVSQVTYPGATPAVTKTYSRTGKIKTVVSSVARRTYGYDDNDNLLSESMVVDGHSFVLGYAYNGNDQLVSHTYPRSGRVVSYAPDVLGRPTTAAGYIHGVTYWPSGLIRQINYANGTVTTYGQHARLWPSSFSTTRGASVYLDSRYTYDGVGNLTSISDTADPGNSRTLGFDKINRLTSVTGPWGSGAIAYSGAGNITSQTFGTFGMYYMYDSANRLDRVSGSRVASYTYDAYGDIATGSGNTYQYDGAPNLTCVNCANASLKIVYAYDGLNRRVSVTKGGTTTYEFYGNTGDQMVEYTPSGKLIEYIYLGGKRVAQRITP